MYFLPCLTKFGNVIEQLRLNVAQLAICKTEICPQAQWTSRTIQVENGAVSLSDDVNMRWPMIVGVDYDAQTTQSQHGWHERSVP
jgi:hypothetical protein